MSEQVISSVSTIYFTWKMKTLLNTFICKHIKWIWLALIWEHKFIDI